MTVKDLIKNKDYNYISFEATPPKSWCCNKNIFIGCARIENGQFIPLDGEVSYKDEDKEVIDFEEWSKPAFNIKNGLTVIVKYEFK